MKSFPAIEIVQLLRNIKEQGLVFNTNLNYMRWQTEGYTTKLPTRDTIAYLIMLDLCKYVPDASFYMDWWKVELTEKGLELCKSLK